VLTLDASGTVYDPGEVTVEEGRITAVGPRRDLPAGPDGEVIDVPGGMILPGLVNAHCHSSDTLVRGTAPTLPLEAWSQFTEAGRFGRTPREIYLSAALSAIEALKTGTTTLLDHLRLSPAPTLEGLEAAAQAYLDIGIRAVVAPVLSDVPAGESVPIDLIELPDGLAHPLRRPPDSWREQADIVEAFIERWKSRIGVQVGPSAPHRCSDALLERCGEISARHGVRIHTHFLETPAQALISARRFQGGPARHLAALGLLPHTSLVHCVHADDVETIAASGAVVVHCPIANLKLDSGRMLWKAFADRRVPLALGTDGALCNDSLSMFGVMKMTALIHTPLGPSVDEVLRAAVHGGARACGLSDVGVLAPGYRADLIVLDPAVHHDAPGRAVYGEEWRPVHAVVAGGRVVVRSGTVTTVDEAAILAEARESSANLLARNASRFQLAEQAAPYLQRLAARAKEVYASTRSGMGPSGSSSRTSA